MGQPNDSITPKLTRDAVVLRWGFMPLALGFVLTFPWGYLVNLLASEWVSGNARIAFALAPMIVGTIFAIVTPFYIRSRHGVSDATPTSASPSKKEHEIELSIYPAVVGTLMCLGIWGYQIYQYLKIGEWVRISVITVLRYNEVSWAWYPTEWIGVHKILDNIPVSIASCAIGILLTYVLIELGNQWRPSTELHEQ